MSATIRASSASPRFRPPGTGYGSGTGRAKTRPDAPLVVGILGTGHLEKGFGVPYQLADLGIDDTAVYIPVPPAESCDAYQDEVADALFVLPSQAEVVSGPRGPALG